MRKINDERNERDTKVRNKKASYGRLRDEKLNYWKVSYRRLRDKR